MDARAGAPALVRVVQGVAIAGVLAYAIQGSIPACERLVGGFFEMWVYPFAFLLPGVLCIARAVAGGRDRAAWALLGGALLAWTAGELYWTIVIGDSVPPAFTPADALWLSFYPACLAGIVLLVRGRVRRLHGGLALDGLIGALGMTAVGAALVFGPLAAARELYPEDYAIDGIAFFGDLALLGVTIAVFTLTAWRPGRALGLVGAGLVLCAAVDGFFVWQGATGYEVSTTLIAALWPAAAVLVGIAAWQPPGDTIVARTEGWRSVTLPPVFAATGLGLLVVHLATGLNAVAVSLAVATLAAVIARMGLTLTQHMRLLATSRSQALTDALTELGNRRRLLADLEDHLLVATDESPRALLLFDLDGFKQYNDWHGHPAGDALLRRLGARLADAVGEQSRAYRLGGDEFCVIVEGGELEARRVRGAALEALSDTTDGFEVACSCGLVIIPADASTSSAVLQVADERLYTQKARRRRFSVSRQTTNALLQAMTEREPDLRDHLDDVAQLARSVGEEMGIAGEELEELVRAAELHDVGKVAVPDAILHKPGPLTEMEWDFMREHSAAGDRILSAAPALQNVARLVRASHERYDGRGYPDRLMGDEIPLGARIVAVCDAYHAMITDRPYRSAMTRDQALEELHRWAGRQFDPEVVAVFAALIEAHSDDARIAAAD
jgi:diguanylate cyclase (GGDEF)-like protein